MPVLGHTFAGVAIGVCTRPSAQQRIEPSDARGTSVFWLPAVVLLAYLPDLMAQLGTLAGWPHARLLGHSIIFAVAATPGIAAVLVRSTGSSFGRAFLTALLSLLGHDALDLLQATDRVPLWPVSSRHIALDLLVIPTDVVGESAVFGGLLVAFVAVRYGIQRWTGSAVLRPSAGQRSPASNWIARAVIVGIAAAAVATRALQDDREAEFNIARRLITDGAYESGLETLEKADRWPSTTKAGRVDYLRAEAYAGLRETRQAELHYLRSYRADPTYFWTVADLAMFYASSDRPLVERRRLAAPYVQRLRSEFAEHRACPEVLARVARELGDAKADAPVGLTSTPSGLPEPGPSERT